MYELQLSADDLVRSLLKISEREDVCLLDSCGLNNLGSHLLIAGIRPLEKLNISHEDPLESLGIFNEKLEHDQSACIFTISYDFGLKLERIARRPKEFDSFPEPDIFLAVFDCLLIHDYNTGTSFLTGNSKRFREFESILMENTFKPEAVTDFSPASSNFSAEEYLKTVEKIKENIRCGDTYQTNLTQQFRADLPDNLTPQNVFWNLRNRHPAPFSAFLKRQNDFVLSISPERLVRLDYESQNISASPIKGTRKRGIDPDDDTRLLNDLITSKKDRSENVMIVDLLRNDIGKVCEFGSVKVEKLCDLEIHPTLFHLVSTISGKVRDEISQADIIKAVFPCGSITGAPKIRTMKIIDEVETANRGLSMGAIGCHIPKTGFDLNGVFELNVAIRTMVIRQNNAIFNVGGGIVIDSDPKDEYEESLLKAKALFNSLNAHFE